MRWPPWFHRTPQRTADTPEFGFAVVGLGHGATKFLKALRPSPTVRVAALVSSNLGKAERLARAYGVPTTCTYDSFDRLANDPHVHAVYLCLPNFLHREFAERAARLGLHVLCEKPLASTVAEAQAILDACRAANVLLLPAYRLHFTSVHARARQLLAFGTLGEITGIRSGFGFLAKPGWRLNPALAGGGSLYDVGIYPVNALHTLVRQPFTIDAATLTRDPNTQLELAAHWQGRLPNGAPIDCRSSYLEKIPDFFEVQTTRATLRLQPAFSYQGLELEVHALNPADRSSLHLQLKTPPNEPSSFRLEAEHLAHCAQTGATPLAAPESAIDDLETLAQIERIAAA